MAHFRGRNKAKQLNLGGSPSRNGIIWQAEPAVPSVDNVIFSRPVSKSLYINFTKSLTELDVRPTGLCDGAGARRSADWAL
jgi:hypothetical protein